MFYFLIALVVLYFLLMIPWGDAPEPEKVPRSDFAWNQDATFEMLESQFRDARRAGCDSLRQDLKAGMAEVKTQIQTIAEKRPAANDPIFQRLEKRFFSLGPMIGACEDLFTNYIHLYIDLRNTVKDVSGDWDLNEQSSWNTLYRLLYGGRIAVEELMLQTSQNEIPPILKCSNESSATPSTELYGLKVHSGDILLSRGTAAVSALIARGNDFPGNFSHVALVHVDEKTKEASTIEAHIETGVLTATAEQYIDYKNMRIMLLRIRSDHPALQKDPMLPHKAATFARDKAKAQHIPYDFTMNHQNQEEWFCSEVASNAFNKYNLSLWMGLSKVSAPGLRKWMSQMGVRYFETQEPSDLEYDPQIKVIAEWRDIERLKKDHIDNAAIDAMLVGANQGDELEYNIFILPLYRIAKAYSWILNKIGKVGPVPEGMDGLTALRVTTFNKKHAKLVEQIQARSEVYTKEQKHLPPYWDLVKIAEEELRGLKK